MPRRIDCHVHAYPESVFQNPRDWAVSRGENWWADCVAPSDRPSIQGWADADQMVRDLDAAEIDQAIMLGWYWQQQSTCEEQNTWMSSWQKQHPDRLRAFAAVNVKVGPAAIAATRRWLDQGFLGIGELLDEVQGYRYTDDAFGTLAELAREYRVPFNLHVTDPKLDDRPGMKATPLDGFVALAQTHPENKFILAHLGGGLPWREGPALPENLYFDTAAVPLIYPPDIYRRALDAVGPDRILFGSDYPLRLHPKLDRRPTLQRLVQEVRGAGLTAEEFDAMMGGNLSQLLPHV